MVKYLANALIGGDGQIEKRNMSWNMIGSFLYALASMVLTIAVIQIVGEDEGGIFSFAYSTFGQHMFMVAYFGIRPFQITDTRRRFTFGEYLRLRLMTCGAALVAGLFYVTVINRDYAFVKAATVFLMVAYKVIDGFADAYEAEFQRDGRLYLTGKSNAFRTVLSVGVFLGSLNATHNLVGSCLAAVLAQLAGVCLFDFSVIGHLPQVDWEVRSGRVGLLFKENVVLLFWIFMFFLPRNMRSRAIWRTSIRRYSVRSLCRPASSIWWQASSSARISRNSRISGSGMRSRNLPGR